MSFAYTQTTQTTMGLSWGDPPVITHTSSNTLGMTWVPEQWLAQVTYKPGWAFELRSGSYTNTYNVAMGAPWSGPYLAITACVPDSNHPEEGNKRFIHTFLIPPEVLNNQERLYEYLLQCVFRIEAHEAMEYLKAGGVRVKNPHPRPGEVLYG